MMYRFLYWAGRRRELRAALSSEDFVHLVLQSYCPLVACHVFQGSGTLLSTPRASEDVEAFNERC